MTSTMQSKADDIEQPLIDEETLSGNVKASESLQRPGSLQRRRWFQRPYAEASPLRLPTETVIDAVQLADA